MLSSTTVCLSGSNSIDKFPPSHTYSRPTPTTKTRATITTVAIAIAIAVTIKGYGSVGANVVLQMTTQPTHTHRQTQQQTHKSAADAAAATTRRATTVTIVGSVFVGRFRVPLGKSSFVPETEARCESTLGFSSFPVS